MNVIYVSPSILPSKSANSVHVIRMAEAIIGHGHTLTLYAIRPERSTEKHQETVESYYGVKLPRLKLKTWHFPFKRLVSLLSGLIFAVSALRLIKNNKADVIISRNFYASYLLALFCKTPLIYETHNPETGWKKSLQHKIFSSPNTQTIVISDALKTILSAHLNLSPQQSERITVLHDAAPANPYAAMNVAVRKSSFLQQHKLNQFQCIAGYFGHLYAGRGVELIVELAKREPKIGFVFFGGNADDINRLQKQYQLPNVTFLGHIPHEKSIEMMTIMDVLFMPYQEKVSIGDAKSDTSKWMSPMKMFEYMSSKVPILSSDLPVLREVLQHARNALLAEPNNIDQWHTNLNRVISDKSLATKIETTAYNDFMDHYTWSSRVRLMLSSCTQNATDVV